MKIVSVRFINKSSGTPSAKIYFYKTRINSLIKGEVYNIIANNTVSYDNPVRIVSIYDEKNVPSIAANQSYEIKTITKAVPYYGNRERPNDKVKKVYFNKEKGTTTIKWIDDVVTTVKCQNGEPFNPVMGISLCYMKRWCFDNRGCYNEVFKKYIEE